MSEEQEKSLPLNPSLETGVASDEVPSALFAVAADENAAAAEANPVGHPAAYPAIAPLWHTAVLILALLLFSWLGAQSSLKANLHSALNGHTATHDTSKDAQNKYPAGKDAQTKDSQTKDSTSISGKARLFSYATTLVFEFFFLGWVWLGMRMRGVPLKILFGDRSYGWLRNIGIAALFWIIALTVLGSCGAGWLVAEKGIYRLRHPEHHSQASNAKNNFGGKTEDKSTLSDDADEKQTPPKTVLQLAPTNAFECFMWLLLSVSAGFCEEMIFRGYLQRQFSHLCGKAATGAALSALCFGLCHGYEGVRSMFLIAVFGALFSVLALRLRSLKPGMIAHAWHDLLTGYAIAALKAAGFF